MIGIWIETMLYGMSDVVRFVVSLADTRILVGVK